MRVQSFYCRIKIEFVVFLLVFVFNGVGMFCEKAVELIRELHRMSDGQLPAFNVSKSPENLMFRNEFSH